MREGKSGARDDIQPRTFSFFSISHLIRGRGWYWPGHGEKLPIAPGDAVMVSPHFRMDYGGDGMDYVEDFLCFRGVVADHLFQAGVFKDGNVHLGNNRPITHIIELALDPSDDGQLRANLALQQHLIQHHLDRREGASNKNARIKRLTERIQAHPEQDWSVKEMAQYVSLSVNPFRNSFYEQTGLNPKAYLERTRMQRAAEWIRRGELSIAQIAPKVGYADPFHFSRVFRKVMGVAPKRYKAVHP